MARVTISDCVEKVQDRFELVVLAANRAKALEAGVKSTLDTKEKNAVLSLREIAAGTILPEKLEQNAIQSFQKAQFLSPVDVRKDAEIEESLSTEISEEFEANGGDMYFGDENVEVDD